MAQDTSMGGPAGAFPETAWSQALKSQDRTADLNRLITLYWRPVYVFIRGSLGKSVEDAKDLTQEFFARLLESDAVGRYNPEIGRFRHYLKDLLRKFLAKAHRDGGRQKRGGHVAVVPLDVETLECGASPADPEDAFDRQWTRDVLARSLEKLKNALAAEGKSVYFQAYDAYVLHPAEGATYERVAEALGLAAGDVRNYLHVVRERLRDLVRECVSEYVATSDDVAGELRDLFPS